MQSRAAALRALLHDPRGDGVQSRFEVRVAVQVARELVPVLDELVSELERVHEAP